MSPEGSIGERCPVCPHAGLTADDLSCPSCGTDLTVLRRVQELPSALLNDGIRLAEEGDQRGARLALRRAAGFAPTRERALLLLGGIEAERGRLRVAGRYWRAAARLGRSSVPRRALLWLDRVRGRRGRQPA